MSARVLNAVLCDRLSVNGRANLEGAGSKWSHPPGRICLWVELENLPEAAFGISVRVRRGRWVISETHTELVLAGQSYWQTGFERDDLTELEPKTYAFTVLVNGVPARTIVADFGAKESE